jgi:hypothetical protein
MTDTTIDQEAEMLLRAASTRLTAPHEGECLLCFVARMLDAFGCDTSLRWAPRYRDVRAPRAVALERRLDNVGGFCDCEIFLNGYTLVRELLVRDVHTDELEPPAELPDCAGVRRTSTRPCANWERRSRQ